MLIINPFFPVLFIYLLALQILLPSQSTLRLFHIPYLLHIPSFLNRDILTECEVPDGGVGAGTEEAEAVCNPMGRATVSTGQNGTGPPNK